MNKTKRNTILKFITLTLLIIIIISFFKVNVFSNVGVVTTRSVDFYIYTIEKPVDFSSLTGKDYVVFKFNKNDKYGFINKGQMAVKRIGCTPGDILTYDNNYFYCNTKKIAKRKKIKSKTLRKVISFYHYNQGYKIPKGKYFVVGDETKSYDSRFWGLLNKGDIYAKANPII